MSVSSAAAQSGDKAQPKPATRGFCGPFFLLVASSWLCLTYLLWNSIGPELLLLGSVGVLTVLIYGAHRNGALGPMFYYDLVRTARRGQMQAHRFLFAVFLAAAVYLTYASHIGSFDFSFAQEIKVPRKQVADFTWSFVNKVLLVQYLAVFLVTPAYVATVLPQEKQQRTLEFMLTTDLSDQEIVLGLLFSRLGNLLLLLITGLPILGFLQFLGGVDPRLVLASFAVILLTTLSAASVSLLTSLYAARPFPALCNAYTWVVIVAFCSAVVCIPLNSVGLLAAPTGSVSAGAVTLLMVVALLFHGGVTLFACRLAIQDFRSASLSQAPMPTAPAAAPPILTAPTALRRPTLVRTTSGWREVTRRDPKQKEAAAPEPAGWGPFPDAPAADAPERDWRPRQEDNSRPRRRVGEDALLWKETLSLITRERMVSLFQPARVGIAAVIFVALLVAHLLLDSMRRKQLTEMDYFNNAFRGINGVLFCLIAFVAAVNAAGRVSREREQQTLDLLRTLPVSAGEILIAKWFGSIWIVLPIYAFLIGIWVLAVLTTALHAAALPLLFAASIVYLLFMSSVGLWFSTVQKTTLRSTLFTVLIALMLLTSAGTTFTSSSTKPYAAYNPSWHERLFDHVVSPVQTLSTLSFSASALLAEKPSEKLSDILAAVAAVHVHVLVTVLLWLSMIRRLAGETSTTDQEQGQATDASALMS